MQKRKIKILFCLLTLGLLLFSFTNTSNALIEGMTGEQAATDAQNEDICSRCKFDEVCVKDPESFWGLKHCVPKPAEPPSRDSVTARYEELNARKPLLQIRIPGLTFKDIASTTDDTGVYFYISWIPELIAAIYKFSIAIVSIVAVIMIVFQGVLIITSRGSGEQQSSAYAKIKHAVTGLLIAWGSFFILYTVNPALVEFNPLKVKIVEPEDLPVSPSYEDPIDLGDTQGTGNVPYFGQFDARWGQLKPGDQPQWPSSAACEKGRDTIQERGCGPTSVAMVLKYLGKDVTPIDTAKSFLGCTGAMINPGVIRDAWNKTQWSDLKFQPYYNPDRALALAAQNYPIIFNCHPCVGFTGDGKLKTYPGHYMVITGSSDGGQTFSINDPGGNPKINKAIIRMTRDQILSPQKGQAEQGCAFYTDLTRAAECLKKIQIKKPSFIYIHQ